MISNEDNYLNLSFHVFFYFQILLYCNIEWKIIQVCHFLNLKIMIYFG